MKTKHNKKRNTAFIFEVLVRELSKAVIQRSSARKRTITTIIKEHFGKGSALHKELHCYRALLEEGGLDSYTAEKMIYRSKEAHQALDRQKIFQEQSAVIKKINADLGGSVFSNFIPSYRTFATIAQIFNDKTPLKQKVIMERQILEILSSEKQEASGEIKPLDTLVVKSFSQRYNEQYEGLLPEQKAILNKYMLSFGENDADFRVLVGNELQRIHSAITESLNAPEVRSDEIMVKNTNRVLREMEEISVATVGEKELKKILKLQELVNEYTRDAANN
jgi:hypothetical protein